MELNNLFNALADVFDGPENIERAAQTALRNVPHISLKSLDSKPLSEPFQQIMQADDAHPVCKEILKYPFQWSPPQTSTDPKYIEHSLPKVHVELIGPDALVPSNEIRLGLYGMLPNFEYGIRTHPAEEVFIMLAGEAYWKRSDAHYLPLRAGGRSYHPSMLPHANKTKSSAFMSIYVWHGDIDTKNYRYQGIPE